MQRVAVPSVALSRRRGYQEPGVISEETKGRSRAREEGESG